MFRRLILAGLLVLCCLLPLLAVPRAVADPILYTPDPFPMRGAPVLLLLQNSGDDPVEVQHGMWTVSDAVGTIVRSPVPEFNPFLVPPDSTVSVVWDQIDDLGNPVTPGSYTLKMAWSWEGAGGTDFVVATQVEVQPGHRFEASIEGGLGAEVLHLRMWNEGTADLTLGANPVTITPPDEPDIVIIQPVIDPPPPPISPGEMWEESIDLSTLPISLDPGPYDVWLRFLENGIADPLALRDAFAFGGDAPGLVVWRASPIVNSVHSWMTLTLTNLTAGVREISSTAPWWIADALGNYVDSEMACQVILPVPPGATYAWWWQEKDWHGDWVDQGWYSAAITTWPKGEYTNKTGHWAPFYLFDPQYEPCRWVTTGSPIYQPGDPVDFRFKNCAPDTVGMRGMYTWWVTNAGGVPVDIPPVLWALASFAPHEVYDGTWDQTDVNDDQVPQGAYRIAVSYTDKSYATSWAAVSDPFLIATISDAGGPPRPGAPWLAPAAPNPANPRTVVLYHLTDEGPVRLDLHDPAGRRVRTLVDAWQAPRTGGHRVAWDGCDDDGRSLPSGTYLMRLRQGKFTATRPVSLVR